MSAKRKDGSTLIVGFFSKKTKPLPDVDTSESNVHLDDPYSLPQREIAESQNLILVRSLINL